jgi:hypothetical protein
MRAVASQCGKLRDSLARCWSPFCLRHSFKFGEVHVSAPSCDCASQGRNQPCWLACSRSLVRGKGTLGGISATADGSDERKGEVLI